MKKAIFGIIILAILAFWGWYVFIRIDKKKAVKIIVAAKAGRNEETISQFGEDFLIKWAKGIKSNSPTFELNGKTYSTDTAKAV